MSSEFSIGELTQALQVSRSGYYAWHKRPEQPGPRWRQNVILLTHIRCLYREHKERYGSPRILKALRQHGFRCGHNRVARLMKAEGLRAKAKRPFRPRTTKAGLVAAPNLLADAPTPRAPNRIWVADITYIRTQEGWLYLAAIMDLYSRRIVGWHAADHLRSRLTEMALEQALRSRRPRAGLLHHSDRGFQYASDTYRALLDSAGATRSMSRKGNCYDNAAMEAFWSSLKSELIHDARLASRKKVLSDLFEYIEIYYNRRRLHSSLGYKAPVAFEESRTSSRKQKFP
jgi:putative transposase